MIKKNLLWRLEVHGRVCTLHSQDTEFETQHPENKSTPCDLNYDIQNEKQSNSLPV